jgi:hypothetical protein
VEAVLHLFGRLGQLEHDRRDAVDRSEVHVERRLGFARHDAGAEHRGPEPGERLGVRRVDHDRLEAADRFHRSIVAGTSLLP